MSLVEIVLYDGDCGLCLAAVRVVLARDEEGRFRFASQSSEVGRRLLAAHGMEEAAGRSLVLLEDGEAYAGSEAALRIMARLRGLVTWASVLRAVPRPVRDAAYALVAHGRRALGGVRSCAVVTPELRARFLDAGGWTPGPMAPGTRA